MRPLTLGVLAVLALWAMFKIFGSRPDDAAVTGVAAEINQLVKSNRVMVFSKVRHFVLVALTGLTFDDCNLAFSNIATCNSCLQTYCGYSKRAKAILSRHLGESGFNVVEIDERHDGDEMMDVLRELSGARTVPRVFIGGKFIGGADDTARLDAEGKLAELLAQAGASG
jgi:glutaredoxin 3